MRDRPAEAGHAELQKNAQDLESRTRELALSRDLVHGLVCASVFEVVLLVPVV